MEVINTVCTNKLKNKSNKITTYILQDEYGVVFGIKPKQLKQAISMGRIYVSNIKLDTNNILVDNKDETITLSLLDYRNLLNITSRKKLVIDISKRASNKIIKLQALGLVVTKITDTIYMAEQEDKTILLVETDGIIFRTDNTLDKSQQIFTLDNQLYRKEILWDKKFTVIHNLNYTIGTIGKTVKIDTRGIINMEHLFKGARFKNLDLTSFDTSSVYTMSHMFEGSVISRLNIKSFNTSKVCKMQEMFAGAVIGELNISNFDISNILNMTYMFRDARINKLNFGNISLKPLLKSDTGRRAVYNMFDGAIVKELIANDASIINEYNNKAY